MKNATEPTPCGWPKLAVLALALTATAGLGVVDYFTGRELTISPFYLVPICWTCWMAGRKAGLWLAVIGATTWLAAEMMEHYNYPHPAIPYWNAFILLVLFVVVVCLVSALRGSQDRLERRVDERTASLRDSEGRLDAIVRTAPDGIVTMDSRGIVEFMNPAAERIFGYPAEDVIGHEASLLMPLPKSEQHENDFARFPKTGDAKIAGIGCEAEGRRKDGTVFPIDLSVSEYSLGGDRMFVGLVRDITMRKKGEDAINRLAIIVESANDPIISKTLDGIILTWNPAAEKVFGYSAAEAIGRPITMLMLPELQNEESEILGRVQRGERIERYETGRLRKDGSRISIWLSIYPIKDDEGNIFGASETVLDVSERKRLESAVAAATEEERGRIARELHDGLGQQLGGALFLSDLLRRDLNGRAAVEGPRATEVHTLIVNALVQAREVSRRLYPVPPDPDGLMTALQNLADRVARDQQIECTFEADSAVLLADRTLATHLYRIAQEAVNNTLKHSGAKRIEIKLASTARILELSVRDYGAGLPADARTRGLGMQTMSDRASLIGGQLMVQNAVGGGVRVICSLTKSRAMSGNATSEPRHNEPA
ncbi:MAG: PAS domain S-box protein [Verrucomicrobiota bacterium]